METIQPAPRISRTIRHAGLFRAGALALIVLAARLDASDETPGVVPPSGSPGAEGYSDPSSELLDGADRTNRISNLRHNPAQVNKFQNALEAARKMRERKDYNRAEAGLIQLLEARAPDEIKRPALLELAMLMQEQRLYPKAQQLYSEYIRRYDKDPSVPEVALRQGYLYREMGVPVLALAKFYAVISTCLNLKLDEMDYYQRLVLRAQAEIAETYYLQGKYEEAVDYLHRLLKLDSSDLSRADVLCKLVRSYFSLSDYDLTMANARLFLDSYPQHPDAPETRFLLADALKKLGRNQEAIHEIDLLLQRQHADSKNDPRQWLYWQQRAGNSIANQLYREGDFLSALQVYRKLAELNDSPSWQIPVWYQIGLTYENLKQWPKAAEMYDMIIARQAENDRATASHSAVIEMAQWRKQYLSWETSAALTNQLLKDPPEESL